MKEVHAATPDDASQQDSKGRGADAHADKRGAHYVAGPGFELAIRATLAHPLEVEVKGAGQDSKEKPRNADRDRRHDLLERRIDALEKAMLMLVDQVKKLDQKLAGSSSLRGK